MKNESTIGDDIELLNDPSKFSKSKIAVKNKSASVLQNDNSIEIIKCYRRSYRNKAGFLNYFMYFIIFIFFLFVLPFLGESISKWIVDGISEIENTDYESWLDFWLGFSVGFLLISHISVGTALFYFYWKGLKMLYAFSVTYFIHSAMKKRLKFPCVNIKNFFLIGIIVLFLFLTSIISLIYTFYQYAADLIENLRSIISLLISSQLN